MKVVIQRVSEASVTIDDVVKSSVAAGMLVLLGIGESDTTEDALWLCRKIADLRIFPDDQGLMNKSLRDINGSILVVSQFTLHASYKKGNRPSFIKAAKPPVAIPLYEYFVALLEVEFPGRVATGSFGADMKVTLVNDGPITILMDTENKE